jgi:hypothetical protein
MNNNISKLNIIITKVNKNLNNPFIFKVVNEYLEHKIMKSISKIKDNFIIDGVILQEYFYNSDFIFNIPINIKDIDLNNTYNISQEQIDNNRIFTYQKNINVKGEFIFVNRLLNTVSNILYFKRLYDLDIYCDQDFITWFLICENAKNVNEIRRQKKELTNLTKNMKEIKIIIDKQNIDIEELKNKKIVDSHDICTEKIMVLNNTIKKHKNDINEIQNNVANILNCFNI